MESYEILRGRLLGMQLDTEVNVRAMFWFRGVNVRIISAERTMGARVANENMRERKELV